MRKFAVLTAIILSVFCLNLNTVKAEKAVLTPAEEDAIKSQQKILREILELFATKALNRPKDLNVCAQEIFSMRVNGMCRDKYTRYYSPADAKKWREELNGKFGGVGLHLTQKDNQIVVVTVLPNTPAEKAGIKADDAILKINDKKPANMSEAAALMRGTPGTVVTVTVFRKDSLSELEFILKREEIVIQGVKLRIAKGHPNIGIVSVMQFDSNVPRDFFDAVIALKVQKVNNIIIDLRNNPGGYLTSSIRLLSFFWEKGNIVLTTRDWSGIKTTPGKDAKPSGLVGRFKDMKVLILINQHSASASEIVAGTMKDWGYTILGEKSYGKGVGQSTFELSDKSQLVLTTFEFLVGNSKTVIHGKGVTPTVEVKKIKDSKKDVQLEEAVKVLSACAKRGRKSKNCDPVIKVKH